MSRDRVESADVGQTKHFHRQRPPEGTLAAALRR